MITPGDIPDKLIELAEDYIRANVGHFQAATSEEKAAAILNAAIEAGLVSPPVYAIRGQDGNLFFDVGVVRLRPGKPQVPAHEHWRGQTK